MEISKIAFENYRNLDKLEVLFSSTSYIIGENGIGKSNLLHALNRIFSHNKFLEGDFFDTATKIRILIQLRLAEEELGIFDDYVDPHNCNFINLIIEQEYDDVTFRVFHQETHEEIPVKFFRNVQYIYYDSIRNPKAELSFEKEKGSGSLLNYIVKHYLKETGEDDSNYIDGEKLNTALNFINDRLQKLDSVSRNNIKVSFDSNNVNFLNTIFKLYDNKNIELKNSGYGLQFSLAVILSLFEKLISVSTLAKKRGEEFKQYSCILAFDEPEIHLHPFAQRALMKELNKMANGSDEGFNDIIKELFGIEKFSAQLLIVSHSDKIIMGNYDNIVRVYSTSEGVRAVSGQTIKNEDASEINKHENHLQKFFPHFCEGLFARKVIFVEGDTEVGAFREFSKKLGIDFDAIGVSIINANGEGTVIPLINLFSLFKIETIGVKDRDVYARAKAIGKGTRAEDTLIEENKLVLTHELNFEFEIVKAFPDLDKLYQILSELGTNFVAPIQKTKIEKFNKDFPEVGYTGSDTLAWDENLSPLEKEVFLVNCLGQIKSVVNGALIAENVPEENIPSVYGDLIRALR